ncbi:unnamed protein product [Phytophthora lilii]|uniref:Unnamed protein product n=1 Tax=Phytophthora lilii TaxID=2077276 RepID=A0A9W6TL16_9STRA|nr:unnamed protein product [Phytophthora lilii]
MDATFVEERRQALEHFIGLIAGKELLKVASIAATYVPTPATVSSLWSSLKDGVFLASNIQQVEIKTDDDYAKVRYDVVV